MEVVEFEGALVCQTFSMAVWLEGWTAVRGCSGSDAGRMKKGPQAHHSEGGRL